MSAERYIVRDWLDGSVKEFDNLSEAKTDFDNSVKCSVIECDCSLYKVIEEVKLGVLNEDNVKYKDNSKHYNGIDLALQQFVGFYHGKRNNTDVVGLVSSMGLTKTEWEQIKKQRMPTYLSDSEIKEINNYFKK